jgi:DNA-binding GntR family transcriptional regulator
VNRSRSNGSGSEGSLADRAYYAIRDLILLGRQPLGAAVSRRVLSEELGMSMFPVSDAVQRLGDGLLESEPQVATRVRVPTEEQVRDLFIIREMLESQSARMFAEHASFEHRLELKQMARQMDTLFAPLGPDADAEVTYAVHSYHSQFHQRIAEYSGCAALRDLIQKHNVLLLNWLYDWAGRQTTHPPKFHEQLV